LFEEEFETKIEFKTSILVAVYIISAAGIDEKILTGNSVPKLTISPEFISERIADARKKAELTLKNVAYKIGCNVGDIRQVEKGNLDIISRERLGQVFPELEEMIRTGRC